MLQAINAIRYERGLPLVKLDDDLSGVCRRHAVDMSVRDYFDHFSPKGQSPNDRAHNAGLPYEVSENIGIIRTFGQDVPEVVRALMDNFLASPDHLANIVDPDVTHVGIGFNQDVDGMNHRLAPHENPAATYTGFGTVLVLQDFCRRRVRVIEPSPFIGEAEQGKFLDLKLDFDENVRDAFLRIAPSDNPEETYDVPLDKVSDQFKGRFAIDREGVFTIAIYANTAPEDWYYEEEGRLRLNVKDSSGN